MAKEKITDSSGKHRPGFGTSLYGMLGTCGILCLLIFVLLVAAKNVSYTVREAGLPLLDTAGDVNDRPRGAAECLLLYQDDVMGQLGLEEMSAILSQMKVSYDTAECAESSEEALEQYSALVLSVTNYQHLENIIGSIKEWVRDGGNLMILYPPEISGSFRSLFDILGIRDCGSSYAYVDSLHFSEDFLLGGGSRDFGIIDAYESSMNVSLEDDCQVFAQTGDEYPTPIVWRRRVGSGTVVVDNLGFLTKGYRGLHCSAFTLLGDACIYPVINASSFYIDDFPSPVPSGYSQYIQRDYELSVKEFYTSRWWPDIYNLAQKYGIKYTGMVIEAYSDQVSGTFERNPDTERYQYFGNMLLDAGGEIGFHGYNHMPLVLENFDYMDRFDSYRQWESYQNMQASLTELKGFCESLYPDQNIGVYVPPSNIISQEGLQLLREAFPEIRTIASVYLPGEPAYCQEFGVDENGIIHTPRVISGYILDDYFRLVALSELNFHLVNSHFQHPDDVMDEDRGAELGWESMYDNLSDYVDWLYSSVPEIRSMTGSEIAAAVQRYDYIEVEQRRTQQGIHLALGDFFDEAWFMLRVNEGQEIAEVSGGEITRLGGTLYLICADSDEVDIRFSSTEEVKP